MSVVVVHVRHLRAAKLCMGGAREWFSRHGLSWDGFVSNGINADLLRPLNDAFANRVIAIAEREASGVER